MKMCYQVFTESVDSSIFLSLGIPIKADKNQELVLYSSRTFTDILSPNPINLYCTALKRKTSLLWPKNCSFGFAYFGALPRPCRKPRQDMCFQEKVSAWLSSELSPSLQTEQASVAKDPAWLEVGSAKRLAEEAERERERVGPSKAA